MTSIAFRDTNCFWTRSRPRTLDVNHHVDQTPIVSSDKIPFSVQHAAGQVEIFSAGDVRALAEALRRVLDHPAEARERARGLRERVRSLDWELKTREFLNYLRQRGFDVAEGEAERQLEEVGS